MNITICDHCHVQAKVAAVTVTVNPSPIGFQRQWSWCGECQRLLLAGSFGALAHRTSDSVSETVVLS